MLTAYLDETGQHTNGWTFVAGFYGSEDQWKTFAPRWRQALGVQRQRLHMYELRWKKPSTQRLLERLGPIPQECGLTAMIAGVKYSDYEDLVRGTTVEALSEPYVWALFPLILTMLRAIPPDERVELIFEDQPVYRERALKALALIERESKGRPEFLTRSGLPKLAKWRFVPKASTSLFDPSDYLVSSLGHHHIGKTSKKARWSSPIMMSTPWIGKILSRKEIREQVTKIKQGMLELGHQV